ncbi:hypothetical protein [Winogradskyella sp. SYSU M77433]|uniref:hypothetical protein n=1 Tax=Winogradskyella sp. SYSU M77433 TaxID=3042722 RepID=UPI0024806F1B|nr:hypothetical protein [Winogradskyella sp. SYSU M77433]MDH7912830.1 hypothetical protein [Winogradskyella sp. SYSU M77433]
MAKKSIFKKALKIIGGIIIFFTLPSLLLFGFMYLKYDEDLPTGQQGAKADALATKMLDALNEDAYLNTDYLEWTFKGRHHYKWYKRDGKCEVYWDDFTVILDLKDYSQSKVFVAQQEYNGVEQQKYIDKAINFFNNDSFWLVAPYKVFDKGVERRLVTTDSNEEALLVTYTTGGSTPGDSYLWHLDKDGKPKSFQMWVDILPIDGLEATWENWTTTDTGALLPTFHKFLIFGLELEDIKGTEL